MVTTSLTVAALVLSAVPAPGWQTDYAKALSVASAEKKPIAVFIGHGGNKVGRMIADGTIPADAAKLLRDSYVCIYLDTDTGAGKDLSGRFEMPEGLVISGPGGDVQALRHAGTVSGPDLTRQLGQFAHAGRPATTVSAGPVPAAAPVVAAGYYAPAFAPAGGYVYPAAPAFPAFPVGGGCANGRCGLPR